MNFSKLKIFIRRREFSNSVWNVADVIILPLMMLLFTPFFIKELGTDQYGIWMFVNSIVASIGIINMGIGDAEIKFISKYRALNEQDNINRIINAGFSLTIGVLILIILLGNIAAIVINNFNLFDLNEENRQLAVSAIQLGAFVFGFRQVEQLFISIFKGYERYDTGSRISIISKFTLLSSQVITVYLGYNLIVLFTVSVFVSLLLIIIEFLYVKIKFRGVSFLPKLKKGSVKEIFSFSTWSWIQSVLSVIAGHVDRLVVITLAGPTFLAYYALASTVGVQIHSIFSAAVSWIFPKVSGKSERKEDLTGLYYKIQLLLISASAVVVAVLIIFEYQIFHTWLGDETYENSILLIKLFLFLSFFNILSIIPYFFLLGVNLIRISTLFMFISVLFTIGFMIGGYHIEGVLGLAYGKLFSSVVSIPIMLFYVHGKVIDKNIISGIGLYLSVALFAAAFYFFSIYSLIFLTAALFILRTLYKEKISGLNIESA